MRSRCGFCRLPTDYEKFFNTISVCGADAVLLARGIPPSARRLFAAAFSDMRVVVETRCGLSPPVMLCRGLPQGSASAPELSKAAQDPILRLRECSPAAYVTRAGTRVAAAGFVDDVEHYGRGAADIRPILLELSLGSQGTGIGFSWEKGAVGSGWTCRTRPSKLLGGTFGTAGAQRLPCLERSSRRKRHSWANLALWQTDTLPRHRPPWRS